jgi:hypothetical protein
MQVKLGTYSAYYAHESDWANLGIAPDTAEPLDYISFEDAQAVCESLSKCLGIKYDPQGGDTPWKLFAGGLLEGASSQVRVTGPALNPWTAPGSDLGTIVSFAASAAGPGAVGGMPVKPMANTIAKATALRAAAASAAANPLHHDR